MTRPKHAKLLVYIFVLIFFSANQGVLASIMPHDHQQPVPASTSTSTKSHSQDAHQNRQERLYTDASTSPGTQDHQHNNGKCDGADHCNHCVNLINSHYSNRDNITPSYIAGVFASYYDITLPADIRPPKHA